MIWSTSKIFIKNIVNESWDKDELAVYIGGDADTVKTYIDGFAKDLWQEGYIEIDYSKWTNKDFMKIADAAKAQLSYISEEE